MTSSLKKQYTEEYRSYTEDDRPSRLHQTRLWDTMPTARKNMTMQLLVDSDVAYLIMLGAKSHDKGHFFLTSLLHMLNYNQELCNGQILTECRALRQMVCSATEAEFSGMLYNSQSTIGIKQTL
eukprot:4052295-Ditylum_brightwellii.AAC.1